MAGPGAAAAVYAGGMKEISNIHAFEDEDFLRAIVRVSGVVAVAGLVLGVVLFALVGVPSEFSAGGAGGAGAGTTVVAGAGAGGASSAGTGAASRAVGGVITAASGAGGAVSPVVWLLCVAAACVAAFALHEGVHAALFKLFAPRGSRVTFGANWQCAMVYACAEGIIYTRRQYLVVSLAPTVAVTALLAAIGWAGGYALACYVVAVVHLTGCTGDWFYSWRILRDRRIRHCEDTSWGVRFLGE